MTELADYRTRLIARYADQPRDLAARVNPMPEARLSEALELGGWSTHQVLVHLRDVEARAFVPRIERILAEPSPKLESFNPELWMKQHYSPDEAVDSILAEVAELRSRGSELIGPAGPEDWNRSGEHPSFGVRTLQWWIEYAVSHFEEHLEQLATAGTG